MKAKYLILMFCGLLAGVFGCKKENTYQGDHDPDVIMNYHNKTTPAVRMDSIESVNFITRQKLIEIYELTSLYSSNSDDSLLQSILYPQMQSYFLKNDSMNTSNLIHEMDSLKVYFVDIGDLRLEEKDSLVPDSIRRVDYKIQYYSSDKTLIDSIRKTAKYILKKEPKKFKNEFVFYFTDLDVPSSVKDTIRSGVTQ